MIKVSLEAGCRPPDCMVYVDSENLGSTSLLPSLLSQVTAHGKRFGLLAYGVQPSQQRAYQTAGFRLVESQLTSHRHKNFVDQQITVDAIEMAVRYRSVKTFVIASGDSDFVPLVVKLQQLGRTVVHFGGGSAVSQLLAQAADVSLNGSPVSGLTFIAKTVWPQRIAAEINLLAQQQCNSVGINLADLGNAMKQKFGFSPVAEFGLKWRELCELLANLNSWQVRSQNGVVHLVC